jgi:HPt (histidine-containing phosphotransfer) domain-containing protein
MDQGKTAEPSAILSSVSPGAAADCPAPDFDRSAFDILAEELGRADTLQTFSVFFNEAENRLKRLRELSGDKDGDSIKHEAHALKGSAGNFGFMKVSDLARALEQNARSITSSDYRAVLCDLETSYAAACACFNKLIA